MQKLIRLEDIFENASKNQVVNVRLEGNLNSNLISAHIYSPNPNSHFSKKISENFFTNLFGGDIVAFIERASKIADEAAPKVCEEIQIAERLENSKIFNK